MELPVNAFKKALKEGKQQIGLWSSLGSNMVAEGIAHSGFDWILLDTEHSPNELPGLVSQLQAMKGGTATPIVRPAWNDAVLVKRLLDIGVQSLLFPFVQTPEEAKRAVAATRYPPQGIRGVATTARASNFGRVKDYLKKANDEICVLVQVETMEAIGRLREIASVEGVDGVFIGPSDLAASMGHLGNFQHADVQKVITAAIGEIRAAGKAGGYLTGVEDEAKKRLAEGYQFVAVGSDNGVLLKNTDALAQRFKS
ncbi:MAG: HpcH/HpaI aldolase/citrate lyase family protein [Magnetospirillum sp.]|jgi:4-hydroxy-2-oxoheptanedioate aldolase|nr:HpcH/HpaI aldolase/citrate lyase family protein [Magnetospirillum sp.]